LNHATMLSVERSSLQRGSAAYRLGVGVDKELFGLSDSNRWAHKGHEPVPYKHQGTSGSMRAKCFLLSFQVIVVDAVAEVSWSKSSSWILSGVLAEEAKFTPSHRPRLREGMAAGRPYFQLFHIAGS